MMTPLLTHVEASATRWLLLTQGGHHGPFRAENLLLPLPSNNNDNRWFKKKTWNAGRHAPVALTLTLDAPATRVLLCPDMSPSRGRVGLVVVDLDAPSRRVAHSSEWTHGQWVTVDVPRARRMRIEFVESPSWIALQGLRFFDDDDETTQSKK